MLRFVVGGVAIAEKDRTTTLEGVGVINVPVDMQGNLMVTRALKQIDRRGVQTSTHVSSRMRGHGDRGEKWSVWNAVRVVEVGRQFGAKLCVFIVDVSHYLRGRSSSIICDFNDQDIILGKTAFGDRLFGLIITGRAIDDESIVFNSNVSAQAALFSIVGGSSLPSAENCRADASDHDSGCKNRIEQHASSGPYAPKVGLAFILCGIFAGGMMMAFKGLDSRGNGMLFSGWLIAVTAVCIGTAWVILGHFPFPERVSSR